MAKLRPAYQDGELLMLKFWCPGCDKGHQFYVARNKNLEHNPVWKWDGNEERPTFEPSLAVYRRGTQTKDNIFECHLFLRNGRLQFLSDCDHGLAGQTVDLPDWPS